MKLTKEESDAILVYLKTILVEAKLDYSYSCDFAVVNINGERIIFDNNRIKQLKSCVLKLEGEL